jgi:hypothetical protein
VLLVFNLREILEHLLRRAEENQTATFVQQHRLAEHLKDLRCRCMDRDQHDLVVGKAPDNFDHVLRIFR